MQHRKKQNANASQPTIICENLHKQRMNKGEQINFTDPNIELYDA
jgi:hypothetical protein